MEGVSRTRYDKDAKCVRAFAYSVDDLFANLVPEIKNSNRILVKLLGACELDIGGYKSLDVAILASESNSFALSGNDFGLVEGRYEVKDVTLDLSKSSEAIDGYEAKIVDIRRLRRLEN